MTTPLYARNLVDGTLVPAVTTSQFQGAQGALRDYLAQLLNTSGLPVDALTLLNPPGINTVINGTMIVDQRNNGAAQTITAAAALAYTVDRFWAACTGANVTGQRVGYAAPNQYAYQFTGATGVTAIQVGTRLETVNTYKFAGQNATLSVDLANSLLTTVTWAAYYATTADTFGTLAAPTKTQIATGTFTVTSTMARYGVTFAVPAAAVTGIEIVLSVGAQVSGTWKIGNADLRVGSGFGGADYRQVGTELLLCQRYAYVMPCVTSQGIVPLVNATTSAAYGWFKLPTTMRAAPSLSVAGTNSVNYVGQTGSGTTTIALVGTSGQFDQVVFQVPGTGFTAGQAAYVTPTASLTALVLSAEL